MRLPWGMRIWELVPEVALGVGLTFFLVTETDAATSAFESPTAIALMVAVAVGWVLARVALVRFGAWPALRLVVFGGAAAVVLAVVVLPAYDDTTVVESLPIAAPPTTAAQPPSAPATSTTTTTVAPADPIALRSSPIHGIDHDAEGTAVVYEQPDGSHVVGLEDIDIQPGPDYDVYVVPGADREDIDGATRLDDLRGNKGTQYYEVPSTADLASDEWTVLVWCQTFDVPVAGATPA